MMNWKRENKILRLLKDLNIYFLYRENGNVFKAVDVETDKEGYIDINDLYNKYNYNFNRDQALELLK